MKIFREGVHGPDTEGLIPFHPERRIKPAGKICPAESQRSLSFSRNQFINVPHHL
jgi:hypothetical protein